VVQTGAVRVGSLYSLGHGGNDAQKTAGIIWLLLITAAIRHAERVPGWVIVACYVTIAFGTLFGGWRIVKTMGQRITKLKPSVGLRRIRGRVTLFLATASGFRCRRRTRSPVRSSASAQFAMSLRCAGVLRAA
jgi:phosphate/sulfate permease